MQAEMTCWSTWDVGRFVTAETVEFGKGNQCFICICSRWWFQTCYISIPTLGNDPIWPIFFRWVEATNEFFCWHTRVRTSNSCLSKTVGDRSFQMAEVYGGSLIINLTHNVSFLGIQTPKIPQNYGSALARSTVGRLIFLYYRHLLDNWGFLIPITAPIYNW